MDSTEQWSAHAAARIAKGNPDLYATGTDGESAAIIAAADFPIDPAEFCGTAAGSLYVIRTAAGFIPPAAGQTDLSIAAALEFAVKVRNIRHIIQIAHDGCGLVRALTDPDGSGAATLMQGDFLPAWTALAGSAISGSIRGADEGERIRYCSEELLRVGFENLMTYPWVLDRVWNGTLGLHGWYVDFSGGTLRRFNPETDSFEPVSP